MDSKPPNVRAAEAVGLEPYQAIGLHNSLTWMLPNRNGPGSLIPFYSTDEGDALALLKYWVGDSETRYWRIMHRHRRYCVSLHDAVDGKWNDMKPCVDISLARAICLALIAASEKEKS